MRGLIIPVACSVFLTAVGCGGGDLPNMGYVSGTVKMDGKPLENAVITFQPEHARPSYGRTDAEGYYELVYTGDNKGATVGTHQVKISCTELPESSGEEGGYENSGRGKEIVPAKYNALTELTFDVEPGSNEANFDITSEGEVVQEGGY
ncbi:hypothetical protein KOR42_27620 [Thalassoglobus neptunius]|uniref:Carboxypeptidase regulatory-like domain-containing protein n=1 Tax=Thalassoglobus neptunius TaxID=1938619 RepID=A0A5C5X0E7_9PLAN|nr:hypothetical protein [Thalassoglobus neptunius]TWT55635.1 hypothetical protein KOR42_27620 [Thalassoglobus neptunius]